MFNIMYTQFLVLTISIVLFYINLHKLSSESDIVKYLNTPDGFPVIVHLGALDSFLD